MSLLWLLTSCCELLLECSFFPGTLEWALRRGWWQPQQITFIRSKQWIIKTRNNLNKTWLYEQQPDKEICQTSLSFLTSDKKWRASYDHDKWQYLINHYLAFFLCLPCFCWSAETDNSQRVRDNDSAQHLKLREKQRLFEEVYQHDVDNYLPSSHLQIDSRKREETFLHWNDSLTTRKQVSAWKQDSRRLIFKTNEDRSCERTCHENMLINRSERSIHTLIRRHTWWSCDIFWCAASCSRTAPMGSISSMEVNVDVLEQMDLMDVSDQEALDVFLNSGSSSEEGALVSALPGASGGHCTHVRNHC